MKKILLLSALLSTVCIAEEGVTLSAKVNNANGLAGREILVKSKNDVEFMNNSNQPKDYSYSFHLCVEHHGCQSRGTTIRVKAHEGWAYHTEMQHQEKYKYSGGYLITATTTVNGQTVTDTAGLSVRD